MAHIGEILAGVNPNTVDTVPKFQPGFEVLDEKGRTLRYVKATTAVAVGDSVSLNTGYTQTTENGYIVQEPAAVAPAAAVTLALVGISEVAIPINNFGWVVTKGRVVGKVAAATAAASQLGTSATSGTLAAITAGNSPRAVSLDAEASGTAAIVLM